MMPRHQARLCADHVMEISCVLTVSIQTNMTLAVIIINASMLGLFEKKIKLSLVYVILSYTTVDIRVHKCYKSDMVMIIKKIVNVPTNIFLFSSIKNMHTVFYLSVLSLL